MILNELDFSQALMMRICHDLAGPLGAINNGIEFLQDHNPATEEEALELIRMSTQGVIRKLQFFRHIYGTPASHGEALLGPLKESTVAFFEGGRIRINWPESCAEASKVSVSPRFAKLILNGVFLLSSFAPHGGEISLALEEASALKRAIISLTGPSLRYEQDMLSALLIHHQRSEEVSNTKKIHLYHISRLVEEMEVRVLLHPTDTHLCMVFEQPPSPDRNKK